MQPRTEFQPASNLKKELFEGEEVKGRLIILPLHRPVIISERQTFRTCKEYIDIDYLHPRIAINIVKYIDDPPLLIVGHSTSHIMTRTLHLLCSHPLRVQYSSFRDERWIHDFPRLLDACAIHKFVVDGARVLLLLNDDY